MLFAHSVNICY